ncbi:transcription factor jumonji jmjC domain-containing protein [Chroococcidiopsis thermalis PCC 7203]|uniref:Transcription factor jumonji jmjC domain-containing protein n=3 Tax=Chroococcidiopsis TaxID=54298 RepID=K9U7W4_CHRTP|nr:transcription factor jumonji jmjC domain-containing protein [Chroococcidiopsis thermalis PCC 7203]
MGRLRKVYLTLHFFMRLTTDNTADSIADNTAVSISRMELSSISPDLFFERYQKTGTPVIITGLKVDDWNLEYLCKQLDRQEFLFRYYGRERYQQDKRTWQNIGSGVPLKTMSFTDYAKLLHSHEAHEKDLYLAKCSLKNTKLAENNFFSNISQQLGLKKPIGNVNLWVAPGGHLECLHYDTLDGILIQMHGAKKVLLFPPSQTYNLYPFSIFVHLLRGLELRAWFSTVYPENPDLVAFPKFKKALEHKQELILEPGEMLYIPMGWWHEVTALGDEMVCSVNQFWGVYPISRAILSWCRWRVIFSNMLAIPYLLTKFAIAFLSQSRQQQIKQIFYRF